MTDGSGDLVKGTQSMNEPIPVCTLFSDGSTDGESTFPSSEIDVKISQNLSPPDLQDVTTDLEYNVNKEQPALCNVFAGGTTSITADDIFSKISEDVREEEPSKPGSQDNLSIGDGSLVAPAIESIKLSSSMETLRLNRSVDSFIVEELIESDQIMETNSASNTTQGPDLGFATHPAPSSGVPSFSISPDDMENKQVAAQSADSMLDTENVNIASVAIEKLSLDDINAEELVDNSSTPESNTLINVAIPIQSNLDDNTPSVQTPPTVQPEIPTTGLLFASAQDNQQNLFPSPVSERPGADVEEDDPFAAAMNNSVLDRRRDAWLPSEDTGVILIAAIVNHKAPDLEMEKITRPGLSTSELLEDPVKELVVRMTGSENVVKRENLTMEDVSNNKDGIRKLMESGNLRSAANLCAKLLATHGQGFGQATRMTTNTSESLQLWYTRIHILTKLKLLDMAATEFSAFRDLDNPDLYFEFYPDVYPGRRGSMVPFSFRLLHAEFPRHVEKPQQSLKRLNMILNICSKILHNLGDGKSEIGEMTVLNPADIEASVKLWTERKVCTLFSMGDTLMQLKDYTLAVEIYDRILKMHPENSVALQSGIGRIYLHLGDIRSAQQRFTEAEKAGTNELQYKVQLTLNKGFMYIGTNNWKEALAQFELVLNLEPHNIIALNNKAVCMLYLGRLKDAIAILESGTCEQTTPEILNKVTDVEWQQVMLQGLISNLSTLYELESSRYVVKKRGLFLKQIAPTCSDSFDTACFKEI